MNTVCVLYIDDPAYGRVMVAIYATRKLAQRAAQMHVPRPHEWECNTLIGPGAQVGATHVSN